MYVKGIDACQSGISYIKEIESENIQKIMQESQAMEELEAMVNSMQQHFNLLLPILPNDICYQYGM